MGESELVLDSLTVEEALRIVGGAPPETAADVRPESTSDTRGMGDWREVLRAAGGEPVPRESTLRRDRPPVARESQPAPRADTAARPTSGRAEPPLDVPIGLTVGSEVRELFGGPMAHIGSHEQMVQAVDACRRCQLYAAATQGVPGEGPAQADVMVVGEAPGANEDATGRPFVGAAGQLLTKILGSVDLRREDVFICNVMKHRPPGNRNPTPDEVAACSPYLVRQVELVKPKVILALGTFAAQTLLSTRLPIGKLRGQVHRYHGVPLIVTYHPAALLRNPGWKRPTWEDVRLARRVLDRAAGGA
jgi:uracil-DNA glycosylase family 4